VRKSAIWFIGSFVLLLVFTGWAGYSHYEPEPPALELVVNEKSFDMKVGTYSLQKWGRVAAADSYSDPADIVRHDPPIVVLPIHDIILNFEESPESVKYYVWEVATGKLAYKSLKGYPLSLDKSKVSKGDYALEVRAKWKNGYVLYYAKLTVSEN
jgi:hypothetical protein